MKNVFFVVLALSAISYELKAKTSLDEILALTQNQNPRQILAREKTIEAQLKVTEANLAAYTPTLGAWAKGNKSSKNEGPSWAVEMGMPVFSWANIMNTKFAKKSSEAVAQDEVSVRQQLTTEAASAYFEVLKNQALIEFQKNTLDVSRKVLAKAKARRDAGLIDQLSVDNAQLHTDQEEINAQQLQANYEYSCNHLLRLIGKDSSDAALCNDLEEPIEKPTFPNLDETTAKAYALQHRPEMASASLLADASEYNRKAKWAAAYLPTVTATGSYGKAFMANPIPGVEPKESGLIVGAINLPVFNGAAIYQAKEAGQQVVESEAVAKDVKLQIVESVSSSISQVKMASAKFSSAAQILKTSNEVRKQALNKYDLGLISTLDYLEFVSRADLMDAQAMTFRYGAFSALVGLKFSLGIAPNDPLPEVTTDR